MTAGDQASRIAVYLAFLLSALVVLSGVAWSVGGSLLGEETSSSDLFAGIPLSYGVAVLAMSWLGVFVVFVMAKAFRVGARY
jgi:hypothetical protein